MNIPQLFQSPADFRQAFIQGLHRLLDDQGLGAYILVLANATFEQNLFKELQNALKIGFAQQQQALQQHQAAGTLENLPTDDVVVFQALDKLGWANIEHVQFRAVAQPQAQIPLASWELQFNPLRALRPPRNAGATIEHVASPFNANKFNFNKPFLRKESIWVGELFGKHIDVLYNKFPFVELHTLLVPERERQLPQFLEADMHTYIWHLCERLSMSMPGIGLGYNAYGASASVNHLHFQLFVREQALPVEHTQWQHNTQDSPSYPLPCKMFTNCQHAYEFITELHAQNCSYNLLYRPGCLYCLPRRFQGSYTSADWVMGHAWYEVCGGVVSFDRTVFAQLDAKNISQELSHLALY